MARSSALLLAAAVLLVAVCGQHTALATGAPVPAQENPVFITVVGTVGDFSNYTRLQAFCNVMTTVPGIQACQIFSVQSSASVANSVRIGAYFYTTATLNTPAAVDNAINTALPLNSNVGGIIRSGANVAGTKSTDAPATFAYLTMHIRFYFRGTQTGTSTALTATDLAAKINKLPLTTAATVVLAQPAQSVTFENNNVYVTSYRVRGYWTNRNTMYSDILTKLRDSSEAGAFILVHTEDVTQATADPDATFKGYDTLHGTPANYPYKYAITLTTSVAASVVNVAATQTLTRNALADFLFPNERTLTTATAVADGSGAKVDLIVECFSSENVLLILQQLNDEIYSGNSTRATFGGILFTGIAGYGADIAGGSQAFRIPTTDFPLQQRYTIPVESLLRFNNQSAAANELCAQLVRRTPNVTACYIERIATAAPAARTAGTKFATMAVDSALSFVLNATDAVAALRMKRNLQLTLLSAAPILGLNFSDATVAAVVREESWRPREQKHAMFTDFFVPVYTTPGAKINYGLITSSDTVGKRRGLTTATRLATGLYGSEDLTFFIGKPDVSLATATATVAAGVNFRVWVTAPRALTPLGLYLRQLFIFAIDAAAGTDADFGPNTGTPPGTAGPRNGINGTGEAFAVATNVLITYSEPGTLGDATSLGYVDAANPGSGALQNNFEDAAAAAITGEASVVFNALTARVTTGTNFVAPITIFALTAQSVTSIVAQFGTVLNVTTGSTFANYPLRGRGFDAATLVPELDYRVFPAVPAAPTTATPVTAPNAPASAPAAPVAPSVFAPGAINGVQVGADFYIIIPPAVDAAALCAAILAEGAGPPYNIRSCVVRSSETVSALPAGAKFAQQVTYQRIVVVLTTADPTSANSLVNNMINGVNNKSFLRRFNIADVNLVPLPAAVPTGSTNQPQPAVAPVVPPATNGTFTTVDIYIVILGTALDSAGQAALNNECGSLLGGGATCSTKNIEQTTAARKMTTQASALRLTETVRAPASTYPSANAIVARLQAAVRSNNNRLGGQQVVSIATIGNGRSAAARAAPALVAFLAVVFAAVFVQF